MSHAPFDGLRVMDEGSHVAAVGTNTPVGLRLPVALVVLLAALPLGNAECGEIETCGGMSPGQQALISAHMAKKPRNGQPSDSFTREKCTHVLAARALMYTPSKNCEDRPAAKLRAQVIKTCIANTITLFAHNPLCQTKAMYTTTQLVWFYLSAVATTATLTEWVRYPLSPIKI